MHSHRAVELLDDTFALSHRLTFNLNGVRVINDSVADGIGQIGIIEVFVLFGGVILRTENRRGCLGSGLY